MKLRIAESSYMVEDIAAVKKYYPNIDDETFMYLIQLDPTYRNNNSLGKYGKWILNLYNKGAISEDDFSEITPLLNQFTTYRNRVQNKDLNSYKSISDLESILAQVVDDDSMLTDRQKLRFLKNVKAGRVKTDAENDYDKVYEDSDWVVCVPNTHEASMKLGKGTEWCTAHENPEWYETYTNEDGEEYSLYIMKNKHTGERYQYCDNPYRGYDYQFMDEDDHDVDADEFMSNLHQSDCDKFRNFLNELNPDFFKVINFIGEYGDLVFDENSLALTGTADYFEPDVVIPEGVVYIGEEAFYEKDINSVYIPSTVEVIEARAFGNSELKSVDFEDATNLISIGHSAFHSCDIKYVYLPDSVNFIGGSAFAMTSLIKIKIGSAIKSIGFLAFGDCSELKEIQIEESIDGLTINNIAFKGCNNLRTVYLPENIKSIAENAFSGCSGITIYSDSDYMREHIEDFDGISLCNTDGELIYDSKQGFV